MGQNILIIGNGFDLYHRLPTRYRDFMFFAKHWNLFYQEYQCKRYLEGDVKITLSDDGMLTEESLLDFAHYSYLMDDSHIDYLNNQMISNSWVRYFSELQNDGMKWVDFETEIQNALYDTEEYSMKSIPKNNGKFVTDNISKRLRRIPELFGVSAQKNGYDSLKDRIVTNEDVDERALENNKSLLVDYMVDELNALTTCLRYYLNDFVSLIDCHCYSKQLMEIDNVDLLNFNYTQTFRTIYSNGLHRNHSIHGEAAKGDMVLGVSDDAFSDTYDYIRFQKYFQRIQKKTGSDYLEWGLGLDASGIVVYSKVYIIGHSLGLADFGVLGFFFKDKRFSEITIFYHSQESYENLVINLVKALGREETIKMIGDGKVVFEQLQPPIPIIQ